MTKDKVDKLRVEIVSALKLVEKNLNVKINVGTITYSDDDFKVRLTGVDSICGAANFYEAEFLLKCHMYGLKREHLGVKFKFGGNVHQIVGLKARNRKYPILTKCLSNGKQYKLTSYSVENALSNDNQYKVTT